MMKTKEDHQWYKDRGRYLFIIFLIMGLVFLEIGLADLVRTRKPVLLEKIQNPEWQCAESEEGTYYYTEVALTSGNYFEAEIGFSQIDPEGAGYEVELLDEYGTVYWIDSRIVSEETELSQVLMVDYSHVVNKADKASFFVYVPDAAKNVLSDINLSRYAYVGGTDPLTNAVRVCGAILLAGLIALTLYGGVLYHKNNKKKSMAISAGQMKSFFMTRVEYVVTAVGVLLVLLILYRNADIRTPLVHRYIAGDEKGYEYNTSCFVRGELNLVNTSAGGTYGAEQFDYPFSEWIQASLIAWIGSALDNPQMTNNLFYFLCYFLNAFSAVWLCRKLQYKKSSTVTIAVLFAFSPYIQMKYEHLWLNGYFIIPIAIYIALCIAGAVEQEKVSWIGVCGGGFLCAYTGLYYAFFSCALFAVALVIRLLRTRRLGKECLSLISCVAGVGMTLLPNLLYWNRSGQPASNPLDSRMLTDAETYSLRLVQMVMPREKHRIGILRDLTQKYESAFINEGSEWVRSLFINENVSSAIGLVAVCGFVLSILWLLMGVKEKRDHTLAAFNLSCILIASSGGLGVLLSFLVKTPVRAYNRMSIWIMLLSLLCFMSLWERIFQKKRKEVALLGNCVLMTIGIFDQTIDYAPMQAAHFQATKTFYDSIGEMCQDGDSVYVTPYLEWPSFGNRNCMMGPANQTSLHWNVPVMMGRPEAEWQDMISRQPVEVMLQMVINAGYNGIVFDKGDYLAYEEAQVLPIDLEQLKMYLGEPQIADEQVGMYFWRLTY